MTPSPNCGRWATRLSISTRQHPPTSRHSSAAVGTTLDFPDYHGKRLDALNDCLRDVATFDYGSDPDSSGTVVAFRHYDRIVSMDAKRAEAVLDIFTNRARDGLLIGHRLIVLVQSDDPDLSFGPLALKVLGGTRASG